MPGQRPQVSGQPAETSGSQQQEVASQEQLRNLSAQAEVEEEEEILSWAVVERPGHCSVSSPTLDTANLSLVRARALSLSTVPVG